jgi:hypothetical protein
VRGTAALIDYLEIPGKSQRKTTKNRLINYVILVKEGLHPKEKCVMLTMKLYRRSMTMRVPG